MRLLWMPTVLRAAGLTVHTVSGWKTRGNDSYGPVRGITCHHTAGSRNSTVQGELNVLLNGSNSAPAPIAQLLLARNGDWHVVASGLCYHNLDGWGGPNAGYGNDALLGIEAQHSGGTEPWTDVQYGSYVRGVAALVRHKAAGYDVTVARVAGHKEHQPGDKSDPTFNMTAFRSAVTRALAGEDDDMGLSTTGNLIAGNSEAQAVRDLWWATFRGNAGAVEQQALARIELTQKAILTAISGVNEESVLAAVREESQRVQAALAAHSTAEAERDAELRALVEQGQSGALDAAEVVRLIGERLTVDGASPAS